MKELSDTKLLILDVFNNGFRSTEKTIHLASDLVHSKVYDSTENNNVTGNAGVLCVFSK